MLRREGIFLLSKSGFTAGLTLPLGVHVRRRSALRDGCAGFWSPPSITERATRRLSAPQAAQLEREHFPWRGRF